MGVCIDVRQDDLSGYETIPQMFIGLGVRTDATSGMALNSAASSGDIDISIFQNAEAMQCFNALIANNRSLSSNVNQAIDMVEYFRGRGNKDGDGGRDTVTNAEIEDYVNSYINTLPEPRPTLASETASVRNTLTQFVALVRHVSSTATPSLPASVPPPGTPLVSDSISSYETISHLYIGLGIRRGQNGIHLNSESLLNANGVRLTDLSIERLTAMAGGNTALLQNIRDTRALIDSIQSDSRFNADNDANVVSNRDLEAYCRALAASDPTYNAAEEQAGLARSINALSGLIAFANAPAPVVDAGTPPDGGTQDAGAGPRVVAENPDAGPVNAANPPPPNNNAGGGIPTWAYVLGGLTALATSFGLGWLFRGDRGGTTPPPANNNPAPVRTENNPPRTENRGSNPPPPPQPAAKAAVTPANNPPPAQPANNGSVPAVDDIEAALNAAAQQQSPAPRAPGGASGNAVNADNVIIRGEHATPVAGIDPEVVRAQVALHYRTFLSEAASRALLADRPLPTGDDLIDSRYRDTVQAIVDAIVIEYGAMSKEPTAEERNRGVEDRRDALSDMWRSQLSERGFIVRRGVPQALLLSVGGEYLRTHSAEPALSAGVADAVRAEGSRNAGENDFMERGLREMMRHIGR